MTSSTSGQIVSGKERASDRMSLASGLLGLNDNTMKEFSEWSQFNYPLISDYAPYVAHVLAVELFFQNCNGVQSDL